VLTGIFVDGPVQGLHYQTATQAGLSSAEGEFKYLAGETVTFAIGGIQLGSASGAAQISPFDLFQLTPPSTEAVLRAEWSNRTVTDFDRVANIALLLVSLDNDHDADNGLDLTGWDTTLAGASLSFDASWPDFAEGPFDKFARTYHVNRNVDTATSLLHLYSTLGITVSVHVLAGMETDNSTGATLDGTIDSRTTYVSTRDANGNQLTYVSESDSNADGTADSRTTYASTYDANGNQLTYEYESDSDANGTADSRSTYSYTYDANGNQLTSVSESDSNADGTADSRNTYAATYDANGNLAISLSQTDSNGDGAIDSSSQRRYSYTEIADGLAYLFGSLSD